ncbi:PREDICTED: polygalacturonase 1 beta-like protein 3 [Tarenaya hassleriana]|uniref:polygalacturonase 1 beta-like protein 3 n=1 Tax=Tarenaya hassleriana TaxID=28532 RepID=UPI00053C3A5E|nr:PREDICTED: polygalacturonase 1 beta-like protein 3 [Tarenaya hassleriana]
MLRQSLPLLLPFFLGFLALLNVNLALGRLIGGGFSAEENPFTPKASLVRYWNKEIRSESPRSEFLLSKASPLSAVDSASFAKLAAVDSLPTRLPEFCSAANLFCFPDLGASLEKHTDDVKFSVYDQKNFTNYGTTRAGGVDSFKNYSQDSNVVADSFRRYSRDSAGHDDKFSNYATSSNVVEESFNSYGGSTAGGSGTFTNYHNDVNNPTSTFTSYSDSAIRTQTFKTYSRDANAGSGQSFTSYGKHGTGDVDDFSSYAVNSNVVGSGFANYGTHGHVANESFTNYGIDSNVPQNNFRSYGSEGNAATQTFSNYRDRSNVGDDRFSSYAKNSNAEKVNFVNYGQTFNPGSDTFTGYGKGAKGHKIGFKTYGVNTTFKDYAKKGVEFAKYNQTMPLSDGKSVNRWIEPGKFFREAMLKEGNTIPMPDIRDKMPKRSFLPRNIISKLPFSASKIADIKRIFGAGDNSTMERIISDALSECERSPSAGETKRCVGSAEDMIDFATSVLGRSLELRTTENIAGSKQKVMIGKVRGINGGKVTKSVSCHQSLYPYLLYYCHSVPKVRVYESDLLDPKTKSKINHGVAICHIDTSAWGASHGAFAALGSRPGQIEVCHWIFENDMTWTIAD